MRCAVCGDEGAQYVKEDFDRDLLDFGEIACEPRCQECAKEDNMIPATKSDYARFGLETLLENQDADFKDLLKECGAGILEAAFKEIINSVKP